MDDLFDKNLANVQTVPDLFGGEHELASMQNTLGFLPLSVLRPDWALVGQLKDYVGDTGQTRTLDAGAVGGIGMEGPSVFNPHLAQMLLAMYAPQKAHIYDPFAGGGTRAIIAARMGHTYKGVELRADEAQRVVARAAELGHKVTVVAGDSQQYHFVPGEFNFCYTCPPYYDLEVYSDLPGDVSNAPTYEASLAMLHNCLGGCMQALQPGSFCVWVVGNFRDKDGALRHYNGDVVRLAQEVGFTLWDELVFWGAAGVAASRSGQFKANRKSVRVHEYALVFKA